MRGEGQNSIDDNDRVFKGKREVATKILCIHGYFSTTTLYVIRKTLLLISCWDEPIFLCSLAQKSFCVDTNWFTRLNTEINFKDSA